MKELHFYAVQGLVLGGPPRLPLFDLIIDHDEGRVSVLVLRLGNLPKSPSFKWQSWT